MKDLSEDDWFVTGNFDALLKRFILLTVRSDILKK